MFFLDSNEEKFLIKWSELLSVNLKKNISFETYTSKKQNSYKPPEQTINNKNSFWQEISTEKCESPECYHKI